MRLQAYLNCHAGMAAPARWGSPRTMIPWEVPDSPRVLASVRRHNGTPILPVQSGEGTPERINPGVQIDPGFRAHELLAFDTSPLVTGDESPSLVPSPVEVGRPARVLDAKPRQR